jgi:hypothetical protein
MKKLTSVMLLSLLLASPAFSQEALTTNLNTDLIQLASMYAKHYAPYEWKRDVIAFDLYRLTPCVSRVGMLAIVFKLDQDRRTGTVISNLLRHLWRLGLDKQICCMRDSKREISFLSKDQ